MKILQINEGDRILHIQFESGQAGKDRMMKKINKFLTESMRASRAKLKREIEEIVKSENKAVIKSTYFGNISQRKMYLDFKIEQVDNMTTIEDYNTLHSVTIMKYTVQ